MPASGTVAEAVRATPQLSSEQEVAVLARALRREGYDDHHTGHITVRRGDDLLTLAGGVGWDEARPGDVIGIDAEGVTRWGAGTAPPAIRLHLELHRARPVGVAVHQHPRYGTLWSALGRVPPAYDQGSALLGDDDVVLFPDYVGDVTTEASARANVAGLGESSAALLAHHGVLVVGDDVAQAFGRAATLEWRCRVAWHVEAVGAGVVMPRERAAALARAHRAGGDVMPGLWEWAVRRELRADPTLLDPPRAPR